jgi:hypothetical protein
MTKSTHGTVRGNTIELAEDLGLTDGQQVEIQVTIRIEPEQTGNGILRTAGALADDPHWDAIMEEVYRSRRIDRESPLM